MKTKRTPISDAPPVTKFCFLRTATEMLPEALKLLGWLGAFVEKIEARTVTYGVWYRHPEIEGRETDLLFTRNGKTFTIEIRDLGPVEAVR